MTETFRTTIEIAARPEDVFDHFIRPELLVRWMGDYARLEATAGGQFSVDINGVLIRGHYVTLDPPRTIEVAWGEAGNEMMPPGSTRLRISLQPFNGGTLLELTHSGLLPTEAAKHAVGWPHFLGRLSVAAPGDDPGADPWATEPPTHA
ncbi:MAG: SRPBCC domain-containing protein [Bauldia sp.]|nr:MAG: SRPBCC domain-containing protein [Bauldia sp.]MBZ0227534.1 SRPBCC domain-containing protein [Bauldia sp.]